jgi:hypothetical protein
MEDTMTTNTTATTVDQLATDIINSDGMDEQKLVALLDATLPRSEQVAKIEAERQAEVEKAEREQKARIAARLEKLRIEFSYVSIWDVLSILRTNRKRNGEGKMCFAPMRVETIAKRLRVHEYQVREFSAYIDRVLTKHASDGQHIKAAYGCRGNGDYYVYVSDEDIAYQARKRELKAEGMKVVAALRERLFAAPSECGYDYYRTAGKRELAVEIDSFYSADKDCIEYSVNFPGGFTFNEVQPGDVVALVVMTAAFYDAAQALIGK